MTHDILERLGLLHGQDDEHENFEEVYNFMQQQLSERRVLSSRSTSSESEQGHTSSSLSNNENPTVKQFPSTDPIAGNNAPPTPPMISPIPEQSPMPAPLEQELPVARSPFVSTGGLYSAAQPQEWMNIPTTMEESMDFARPLPAFKSFTTNFENVVINTGDLIMPDWNGAADFNSDSFIQVIQ